MILMKDERVSTPLAHIPTCDLHAELLKRDGVSALFLGPDDEIKKVIKGPAWVVVNRD